MNFKPRIGPPGGEKIGNVLRHPRNRYTGKYDFVRLKKAFPELGSFIIKNPSGESTIDFANPAAVKSLNRALLKDFYEIEAWDVPDGYLCPPIPGRSDYIHTLADLLGSACGGNIPTGSSIRGLDVGVGANCIYPIIGNREYGWSFVGTDTDLVALESAQRILDSNPVLDGSIELRHQEIPTDILNGMFMENEVFDFAICNPPFHSSLEEAQAGSRRKWENLGRAPRQQFDQQGRPPAPSLNFGGQNSELWCPGGELAFVRHMIQESADLACQCFWFSALISKEDHLHLLQTTLSNSGVADFRTLAMAQGQKKTRILAWTFLNPDERDEWRRTRWLKS